MPRQARLDMPGALHHIMLNPKELKSGDRRRKVSQTRASIAYRSVEELGLSTAEVARHLGVSTSSITRAIAKLEGGKERISYAT